MIIVLVRMLLIQLLDRAAQRRTQMRLFESLISAHAFLRPLQIRATLIADVTATILAAELAPINMFPMHVFLRAIDPAFAFSLAKTTFRQLFRIRHDLFLSNLSQASCLARTKTSPLA
jgi:hypothetical protein